MDGIDRPSNGQFSNLWCLNHTTEMTAHISDCNPQRHEVFCQWIREVYVVLHETTESIIFMHPNRWICKYVTSSSRIHRLLLLTRRHAVWQGTNNWNRHLTFVAHIEWNRSKPETSPALIVRYWNFGLSVRSLDKLIGILRVSLPSEESLYILEHTCLLQH